MKKVVITGPRRAEIVEVPEPRAREDWAVVKVHVAPMCTEYKAWLTGHENHFLGHEAVGEVVEVAQPGRVAIGDRVVVMPLYACGRCRLCVAGDYIHCQNALDPRAFLENGEGSATYAQYLAKPGWMLPRIPDEMTYEQAALALCALGPSFGAFDGMGLGAFDTVLITGLGPVGLGAVVNAKFRGARVIAVESIPYRTERARMIGADHVVDPGAPDALQEILDLTEGIGVDQALDCSGVVAAQRLCIDATRRRGQVAFVGECQDELGIRVSPDMIRKGLTVRGSWHYNLSLYPRVLQVIAGSPSARHLVSHILPMSRAQDALVLTASHQCAKVLLRPWE